MKIKDWHEFQHFKDRTPPWIKLYRDILNDPEWHSLDGEAAKSLVMIWLIASEDKTHSGTLPDVKKLAFRLRKTEKEVNQLLTKISHWLIQDDITVISDGYQVDTPEKRESRVEGEKKTKKLSSTTLPENFAISERVVNWASLKGYSRLNDHLDNFVSAAKRKAYSYADWDEAFMEAVRKDWAKLGSTSTNHFEGAK